MIYFLQAGKNGPIRIDYARSEKALKTRLASLQADAFVPYTLLAVAPNMGPKTEKRLHAHFGEFCTYGQWYRPEPGLLELVEWIKEHPLLFEDYAKASLPNDFRPTGGRPPKPKPTKQVSFEGVTITKPSKADLRRAEVQRRIELAKAAQDR